MGSRRPSCAIASHQSELAAIIKNRVPRGSNGRSPAASILGIDSSGNVIEIGYEKNAGVFQAVASTQKIMTAWVISKYGNLSQNVRFTDTDLEYDLQGERAIRRKTGQKIQVGDSVPVSDYLYTLLTQSSNGAAMALSRGPTTTTQAFVRLMNQEVTSLLGSNASTYFQNPNGLTDSSSFYRFADTTRRQGSTTREMASLLGKFMANSRFRSRLTSAGMNLGNNRVLYKLGVTNAAGHTLVAHFSNPGAGCSSEGVSIALFGGSSDAQFTNFAKAYQEIYDVLAK